jgi:hypothetical protein
MNRITDERMPKYILKHRSKDAEKEGYIGKERIRV